MMDWYLKVVRDNYANFSGRARRSEYWYYVLCNILITLALGIVGFMIFGFFVGYLLYALYSLAMLVPSLAVAVRRLHDVDKSGWFYFIILIPLIGPIWLLVLFATEGTPGPNQYGEDPKSQHPDISEIGTPNTI